MNLPARKIHPTLPLWMASWSLGLGAGSWLSKWQFKPGNDAADAIVFHAFAANFAVVFALWCLAVFRPRSAVCAAVGISPDVQASGHPDGHDRPPAARTALPAHDPAITHDHRNEDT